MQSSGKKVLEENNLVVSSVLVYVNKP